jgi:phospholipid/cholesterol/gamma-HCH transport system substrate-binding protein
MENKSHALTAGLFTLLLLAAAIWVAIWFNRDNTDYVPYVIPTEQSIPGLYPQADVRYRGLDVGRVEDIAFDPKVPGQLLIHIRVRPDTPITYSTYATLAYQGVTGIAYVELNDSGDRSAPLPSSEEDVARIEMRPGILTALENRGQAILQQAEQLAKGLNQFLNDENQEAIISAFNNVSEAANALETIPRELQPSLERLPRVMAEAEKSLAALTELTRDLDKVAENLDDPKGTIAKISEAAESVRALAEEVEREAIPLTEDARRTLRNLDRTLDNFNNGSGLLFPRGPGRPPGPGEEGFVAPSK